MRHKLNITHCERSVSQWREILSSKKTPQEAAERILADLWEYNPSRAGKLKKFYPQDIDTLANALEAYVTNLILNTVNRDESARKS